MTSRSSVRWLVGLEPTNFVETSLDSGGVAWDAPEGL